MAKFREIVVTYWPIAATVLGGAIAVGVSYMDLNAAVGSNTNMIQRNSEDIERRTPVFLFDAFKSDADEELVELAEAVEANEDAINKLLRRDDQTVAQLELELTRLRGDMDRSTGELRRQLEQQARQLETIIRLLEER